MPTPVDQTPVDQTPVDQTPLDQTPLDQTLVGEVDEAGLTMHLYERGDWSVIEISGELDIQGVPLLRRLLVRAGHDFVLDLTRVTFLDCGGLRIIVGPTPAGVSPSRRVVSAQNSRVHRLLRLTGWEDSVLLYTSVDAAVRDRE